MVALLPVARSQSRHSTGFHHHHPLTGRMRSLPALIPNDRIGRRPVGEPSLCRTAVFRNQTLTLWLCGRPFRVEGGPVASQRNVYSATRERPSIRTRTKDRMWPGAAIRGSRRKRSLDKLTFGEWQLFGAHHCSQDPAMNCFFCLLRTGRLSCCSKLIPANHASQPFECLSTAGTTMSDQPGLPARFPFERELLTCRLLTQR